MRAALMIVGVIAAAFAVGMIVGADPKESPANSGLREVLEQQLKDPGSVQYRNELLVKRADDQRHLCGEFNARNSFGAYPGFRRFIASSGTAIIEDASFPATREMFDKLWLSDCMLPP